MIAMESHKLRAAPSRGAAFAPRPVLERYSVIIPDQLLSDTLQGVQKPRSATVSRGALAALLSAPSSYGRFKFAVEQARFYERRGAARGSDAARLSLQINKALVNVGAQLVGSVTGRVSTEVDPRASHDADALVACGAQLAELYEEVGVPRASIVQPNVARLCDWYDRHPGVIRDPDAPRQAARAVRDAYGEQANPGLLLVQKLYAYVKAHAPHTRVMASGLRSREEVLRVAGCDFIVLGPKLLHALARAATLEGYNDGLRCTEGEEAVERGEEGLLAPALTQEAAEAYEFAPRDLATITRDVFDERIGMAAAELLEAGVARLVEDADRFERAFLDYAAGQE